MKVLIIDDSPEAIAVAKVRLAKEDNLIVLCAEGGSRGLEMLRTERPDLVLLDVDMPDISGFDLCRMIKSDPELCMVPVIFLTGSGSAEDKVRGLDLGAVDYISKPFDAFELRARVRAALRTKHLQDLLIEYAQIDPLTSLPNRRALQERLRQEWDRILRHGGSASFIMVDLDHFKLVNDTYGHSIGDRVLQEAAKIILGQCRKIDLPARYGGEEFMVLLRNPAPGVALEIGERIRTTVRELDLIDFGVTDRISVSVGVATGLASGEPISEIVERADRALYAAKRTGRDRVVEAWPSEAR